MNRVSLAVTLAAALTLVACDKMQQQGPPPSYQSPTLGTAQAISGVAEPAASAASAAPAKP